MTFDELFTEFHPRIRRYLRRLVGEPNADDIAQVTFANVHDALPRFRHDASVSTWIYKIATNAAIDFLRKRGDAAITVEPIDEEAARWTGPTPEQTTAQHEMSACVAAYVDRLPLPWRTVLVLSEQDGFTNQEIADALEISLDNVKIRLHRARRRLKSYLEAGCQLRHDARNVLTCEPKPQPVSFRR